MPSRTFRVPSITTRSPFFKPFATTHWMLALSLAMAARDSSSWAMAVFQILNGRGAGFVQSRVTRDLFLPVGVVGLIALELCLVAGTGRA